MVNPFVDFAFPISGQTARRTMPTRLAEIKNVLDFGAYNDGTNATATTAAIQAAIDVGASDGLHGTIYFPPGSYTVNDTLTFNHVGDTAIRFVGEGKASTITGNFAGFIFERSANPAPATLDAGPIVFEHMQVINNSQANGAGCIRVGSVSCVHVRNCSFTGVQCVWFCGETYDASQAVLIENCPIHGSGILNTTGNAVVIGGAGCLNACDITGHSGTAVRIFGKGASIRDTRFERSRYGVVVGKFPDDTDDTDCGNFSWIGGSTESNGMTLEMHNCTNFLCAAGGTAGGASPWISPAITGTLTLTSATGTVTTDSSGIDAFGHFRAMSKTGTITAEQIFTVSGGASSPLGAQFHDSITTTPVDTYASQSPRYNTWIGPNVRSGVFAAFGAGSQAYEASWYFSDTTDRAGIVVLGCANTKSAVALGTNWRLPTTAHTVEFINCITDDGTSPTAEPAPVYLYSGLPTGGNRREGDEYTITDAATGNCSDGACNWGANVTGGGGALHRLVRFNGTNWTVAGK